MNQRSASRAERMPLSRDRIIEAATDLIDREGVEALSMRRLAAELGFEGMSLYNHVANKEALLDGVANFILGKVESDHADVASWEDRIRAVAQSYRQVAVTHPAAFTMALTRPMLSVDALRPVEALLHALRDGGFTGRLAVHLLRSLVSYLTGALRRELGPSTASTLVGDGSGLPALTEVAPLLADLDPDFEFEFGLDLFFAALRTLRAEQAGTVT